MFARIAALTIALAAAVPSVCAQRPVVVRGEVVTNGTLHTLSVTKTQLVSSTVNLRSLTGFVMLVGTWNGAFIDVQRAQVDKQWFSMGGVPRLGGSIQCTTSGVQGDFAVNAIGFASRLELLGDQALLIASSSAAILGTGVLGRTGAFTSTLPIPNVPSLIGLDVLGQAMMLSRNGTFFTTNLDALTIN